MTAIHDDVALSGVPTDLRDESLEVRAALSALGRLLGAALIEPARNRTTFIADQLRTSTAGVASVTAVLPGIDSPLVHVAVAGLLAAAPNAVLTDDIGCGVPGYELITVAVGEHIAAPDDLAAFIPTGEAFEFDVVIVLTWHNGVEKIALNVRRDDHDRARGALAALVERARTSDNFYRGQTLRVRADDRGLSFTPVPPARVDRADVVHPTAVWNEVDTTIGGLTRHGPLLVSAGLGASRGLLLVGAPGVGKTALCRVIASELPAGTTVLLVDASVTARGLAHIYESLPRIAPAAVFLDDIDLLASDRRAGTASAVLHEFLTQLDGFTPPAPVLTVATTNVIETIDPALLRAGRFDSVIEIGAPTREARAAILRRYLRTLGDFDVTAIAAATEGASGADLREIVRRAVLEHGTELTSAALLEVTRSGRWKPAALTGQYL